ncbi:hypothetical protein [Duganella sp. BuS-21]|uniref:hypothetical protein n=1 Tax=Duganella sp. BuS-21 TaxID=2943848 RepID=UPI0035A5C401
MTAILKIHSTTAGTLHIGHSWIEYAPIDGDSVTFGTWGNRPTGEGNGLLQNVEGDLKPTATRSSIIDHQQELRLFDLINTYKSRGEQAWTLLTPCSTFASDAWQQATGERLVHQTAGVSTPARLAKAIMEANQRDLHERPPKPAPPAQHGADNYSSKPNTPAAPRKKRSRRI